MMENPIKKAVKTLSIPKNLEGAAGHISETMGDKSKK